MRAKPRLKSFDGCLTCKRRRKKCDEAKPSCGACQRLYLRCLWKCDKEFSIEGTVISTGGVVDANAIRRIRSEDFLNSGPDLSAFTDLICGTYVLEKCCDGFNSPLDPSCTSANGVTIHSTLSFAPTTDSLAWGCMVGQGLLLIGKRYQDRRLIEAGRLQYGTMLRKISAAIGDDQKRHHLDTVAAIDNMAMSAVTAHGILNLSMECEMMTHVAGILMVIDTMHPEQFQSDRALALLEFLRFPKVLVALILKRQTCLTSEAWKTVPWVHARHVKSSAQRLTDVMCDVAALQANLPTAFPHSQPLLSIEADHVWKQVGSIISNLHEWRHSVESDVRLWLTIAREGAECGPQARNRARPVQLYELGAFNMLLIYLCGFLIGNEELLHAVNVFACKKPQLDQPEQEAGSLLTASVLPIIDAGERIRIAAVEIVTICDWVLHEGVNGVMLAYLAVPIKVARGVLERVGDARTIHLEETLRRLSDFWTGRS